MRSRRVAVDSGWLYLRDYFAQAVDEGTPTAEHGAADFITLDMNGGGDDPDWSAASPVGPSFLTVWAGGIVSTNEVTLAQRIFMGLDPLNADFTAFPGFHYELGRLDPLQIKQIRIGAKYDIVNSRPREHVEVVFFSDNLDYGAKLTIDNGVVGVFGGSTFRAAEGVQTNGTDLANVIDASAEAQTVNGLGGDDTLSTGAARSDLFGDGGNDTLNDTFGSSNLYGGAGNDTINAGQADYVSGGDGNDLIRPFFEAASGEVATGFARYIGYIDGGADTDRVVFDLSPDPRDLQFALSDASDPVVGTFFALGETLALVNIETVEIRGGAGNDTLGGASGNDAIYGSAGADTLSGGAGNDLLDGGVGGLPAGQHDVMVGGSGDDTMIVDVSSDEVIEEVGGGTDTVQSLISYTLGANLENLTLSGTAAINGTGNTGANTLVGNDGVNILTGLDGADRLIGGKGIDTMIGGKGDDIYYVDVAGETVTELAGEGNDTILSSVSFTLGTIDVETLRVMGTSAINATGNNLANSLIGNDAANVLSGLGGADVLNGGKGDDTLIGGTGDDIYFLDSAGDTVQEAAGGGNDLVYSPVSYVLGAGAEVETLRLQGAAAINATGNELANVLLGNDASNVLSGLGGADVLNGFKGADTMTGGTGDDAYYVDDIGDKVIEVAGEGNDTVYSTITFGLGGLFVESLRLMGSAAINATGNSLANVLVGNSGANVLNGMTGADTMIGGLGDDTFYVENAGDRVIERVGGGNADTIISAISYTLAETYVETLQLTGTGALNATGNGQANTLIGNDGVNILTGLGGADVLDGGKGADTLVGGLGDDSYVVDDAADKVTELVGEGTDQIASSVTYALTSTFVETLRLTGTTAINATGNDEINTLIGNDAANTLTGLGGNDTLDGGKGVDVMLGGKGDDIYLVDATTDKTTELNGEGTDTVYSTATFGLAATFIEVLILTGTAAINGSGNGLGNTLIGNSAANALNGQTGLDTLDGGLGADTLIGGDGADVFRFSTELSPANIDKITDFATGLDRITLVSAVFNEMAPGALAAGAFYAGTAAHDADDRIIYEAATGKLLFDSDGNGSDEAVVFATLAVNTALAASDFLVI